ncbi:hypothetical protein DQ04_03641080 [Trypanosoma grayi]|uniref:hypothetical protein n=1 Tax=Trypanosoma grayi TaxID=71804 RepID=UPI0004F4ACFC|nr:hypothetical protein DQ04_03641080 [Trypanosoma grayi]KEG10501.1 hypothetical protein DQ04_03641080 [Trypanosoma grayi]
MARGPQLRQCCAQCACGCGCCRLLSEAHAAREERLREEALLQAKHKWHPLEVPKMGQLARRFMNEEQDNTSDQAIAMRMRFMY